MSIAHKLAEKIRKDEPIPRPLATALQALTPLVRAGMWLRLRKPREHVDARVISFGNITAGGTGKTPAVIERVRAALALGHKVAVLTRGYGTRSHRAPLVADAACPPAELYVRFGDEAALIIQRAPGAIVVKCADRVAAARVAIEQYGCNMLILDDGFQYVRLERDENILVIDATNPFGNGCLVPRGILREPLEAMRRANSIIITRCDQTAALPALIERLKELCPDVPIRTTRHAPKSLWHVADGRQASLAELIGRDVRAVCAIGNPESFHGTLESLGAMVTEKIVCRDHARLSRSLVSPHLLTVCTEKDAMRFKKPPENLYSLGIELQEFEV